MKRFRIKNRFWIFLSGLIIFSGGVVMAAAANKAVNNSAVQNYFQKPAALMAVWDWSGASQKDTNKLKTEAHLLRLRQVNATFVDISGVAGMKLNSSATQNFSQQLSTYVKTMNAEHINVYAAAGDTDWSKPAQQYIPLQIQNFVYQYNQNRHYKPLRGLEFDIESYNQKGFAAGNMDFKSAVLTDYLDMIHKLVANQQLLIFKTPAFANLDLGFAIPYWYDNENRNIDSVTWNNKTGPELYHLLDELNQLPNSNVVVMAYRNAANGNDGSIAHSRTEVGYAQAKAPKVRVIIGQETTDVEPVKITFFGESMVDFNQEINSITAAFKPSGVFGGIAINDTDGLLALKQSTY